VKKFRSLEAENEKKPVRPAHSEELENYLNDEIKSDCISPSIKSKLETLKSDKTTKEPVDQDQVSSQGQPEMHITSNLTTLNLDGENSSSDGLMFNQPPSDLGKA